MDKKLISDNQQINKSLKNSFRDGIFASAMNGFTQDYFTPFLLLLGGTAGQVGILNALPNFFAALVQLKTADVVERLRSRKIIINTFVLLQALMLLPMAIIALYGGVRPAFFIAVVILFSSFGAFATSAWGSLMSDHVPEHKRGEYFGWRNKILGFIVLVFTFIAGFVLNKLHTQNIFYGFAIIFSLAFIFRMFSWFFLTRMHEPPLEYKEENRFTLVDFLSRLKKSNFAQFVLFIAMMNFSVNLASPFFAVLMLEDLHFSYMQYSIITIAAVFTLYSMISRWGRLADKFGNLRIIKFVSPLIGIIPFLWILNRNPLFLFLAQLVSGLVWSGFNLCATNFIYDAVTPEKRTRCISYFNVFNGLALCCGALLGGFLLQRLPPLLGYKILSLFLISFILRMLVGIFMPMKLKEVRLVQGVSNRDLFLSVIGIKPLLGIERKTIRH